MRRSVAYFRTEGDLCTPIEELPRRDARWVQRSIGVALTSSHEFKMGAVAVRGGKALGFATNRKRNDPRIVEDWFDCSYHAEQSLVETLDAANAIVYVARLKPSGGVGVARPCKSCLHLLTAAGVRRVVWTHNSSHVGVQRIG